MYIDVYYKDEKDYNARCYVKTKYKSFDESAKTTVNDGFFYHKSDITIYIPGHRIVMIKKMNDNEQCDKCEGDGKCQNQGTDNG